MFRKCKYCHTEFNGKGDFCSDVCEIKNYASEVVILEKDIINLETKEELPQDSENF